MQIKVELLDKLGSDEAVANAAWVSSGRQKNRTNDDVVKLIDMIIRDGHLSCLEHVVFRFRIEAPLYIIQQITRHRIASYNQASGRYKYNFKDFLHMPDDVMGLISQEDEDTYNDLCEQGLKFYQDMKVKYKEHPQSKRINEILRGALPTSTITALVMTINLRSWLNFYQLRSSEHAQPEIREVARQMRVLISRVAGIEAINYYIAKHILKCSDKSIKEEHK